MNRKDLGGCVYIGHDNDLRVVAYNRLEAVQRAVENVAPGRAKVSHISSLETLISIPSSKWTDSLAAKIQSAVCESLVGEYTVWVKLGLRGRYINPVIRSKDVKNVQEPSALEVLSASSVL